MIGSNYRFYVGEESGNFIIQVDEQVFYFGNGWTLPGAIIIRSNGVSFLHENEALSVDLREGETIHFASEFVRDLFAHRKGLTVEK